ncbi:MAG: ABC transporter ATP-binding protein [Betaproteobacteria bacterium]|nr:ABC transporter ATP-binding protein [Betaproteobacteria bacterium]
MKGRVEIDKLNIRFKARGEEILALDTTNLTLEPGSFTALIGPSGCGKSTLLNAIAGFVDTSSGTIRVDGKQVAGPDPEIGVVFQQYALFPWFSAIGNVDFALKRLSLSRAERRERAMAALAEVGLAERALAYPAQLSGGMKQRVALARIFAATPKVLLMDEPFGALDAQTRISMHELLLGIWEAHRVTVLFITHDVDEALLLSDRLHVMSTGPGRIIESLDIHTPRPRSVELIDEEFVGNRNRIIQLLRHAPAAREPSSIIAH